jgi:polysaccharide export outer membrane protein
VSRWGPCLLAGLLALPAGCAFRRARLERSLLTDRHPPAHTHDLEARYAVHCPDVLAIQVQDRPDLSGPHPVGPDGRIDLGPAGRPRVDGLTAPRIAAQFARDLEIPAGLVRVRVAEYKSQLLYLFGEVDDKHQVVPYRGPETVLDLLQRVGGVAPGAAPSNVRVVRAHVADGKPPEVFQVDLAAIVLEHDLATNVRLEPFDRIHIGQSDSERWACCAPPWLRSHGDAPPTKP